MFIHGYNILFLWIRCKCIPPGAPRSPEYRTHLLLPSTELAILAGDMLTRNKRILFTVTPVVLFLLTLTGAEVILRAVHPSSDGPFVREVEYDGIAWYQLNREYLKKYFPASSRMIPEFKPVVARKQKLPNTRRIICLGESSMFGTPYQMTCNIPGILRKQLRALYPDYDWEVLNLGASAINTHVIADFIGELDILQPDLIIIYTGHNEYYGPDGIGASWLEKAFPSTIHWKYAFRQLRIVSTIRSLIGSAGKDTTHPVNLMKQVSEGQTVDLRSDESRRIISQFQENLHTIIRFFSDRRVPVLVGDIVSNPDFPPFISAPVPDVGDPARFEDSIHTAFQDRTFATLLPLLEETLRRDTVNAFLHYWLGKTYLEIGDTARGFHHLLRARDEDLLKFRAPGPINAVIRTVCRTTDTPCASIDSLFTAARAAYAERLFWEHLHPTAFGYYLIATEFLREMGRNGLLPVRNAVHDGNRELPFHYDSLSIAWIDLAFADLSMQHLTSRWPFTRYRVEPVVMRNVEPALAKIAEEAYRRTIIWDQACYSTALFFWRLGMHSEAIRTYEAILEEYPTNSYAHYLLGNLLGVTGRYREAVRHYRASIASNPDYPNARLDLGLIEINGGQFDSAIVHLSRALDLASHDRSLKAHINYALGAAHANKKDYERAVTYLDEALRLQPGYREAETLRSAILRLR